MAEIAKKIKIYYYKEQEYVVREGQVGNDFYMILSGQVQILKNKKSLTGTSIEVNTGLINQNGSFGEMALFDEAPR